MHYWEREFKVMRRTADTKETLDIRFFFMLLLFLLQLSRVNFGYTEMKRMLLGGKNEIFKKQILIIGSAM